MLIQTFIGVSIAYLFGSISSAIIVCKLMHLPDPRTQGSHNPGATNVLRIGGKKAALITLLGDTLKGVLPVLMAKWLGMEAIPIACIAFGAFFGHLFPIFFRFEGGKGVATTLGCILALSWPVGACWISTWLLVAVIFRYSSLAALITSLLAPIYVWFFTHEIAYVICISIMSAILIFKHRSNILKLWEGTETKIGTKKSLQ